MIQILRDILSVVCKNNKNVNIQKKKISPAVHEYNFIKLYFINRRI